MVVVRHEVTYLRPLLFNFEPVLIECWVTDIRAASFTIAYEIFRESRSRPGERNVFARATTVLTPFVFAEERPRRITPEERTRLEQFHEPRVSAGRWSGPSRCPRSELGHFPVHVRFSDVDVYGHVNNVKYFEYFQEARLLFITNRLMAQVPKELGLPSFVIAQTDVDYKQPILFRAEPYDCWSRISRVGARSFTQEAEIRDGDTAAGARGRHRRLRRPGDGPLRRAAGGVPGAATRSPRRRRRLRPGSRRGVQGRSARSGGAVLRCRSAPGQGRVT